MPWNAGTDRFVGKVPARLLLSSADNGVDALIRWRMEDEVSARMIETTLRAHSVS
jgi:hypothetical protein